MGNRNLVFHHTEISVNQFVCDRRLVFFHKRITLTYGYNGAFAKAKHIVLMGYSLPKDDALWRTYFLSKKGKGDVHCSVVVGYKGEKRWINFGCVDSWLSKCKEKDESSRELDASGITTVETAMEIFGKDNVRVYAGGIPQVFHNGIDDVRELLYPKQLHQSTPYQPK